MSIAKIPLASVVGIALLLASPNCYASPQSIYVPYFLNAQGFNAELILHNVRFDLPTTVSAAVLTDGREVPVVSATLTSKETVTYNLSARLAAAGYHPEFGAVVIRYSGDPGALSASSLMTFTHERFAVKSPALTRDRIRSSHYAAAFWIPEPDATSRVALMNTADNVRRVRIVTHVGQRSRTEEITLAPTSSTIVSAEKLLPISEAAQGGIAVGMDMIHDGKAGDVLVDGSVCSPASHYASPISFIDLGHGAHDRRLRAGFVFNGTPPTEYRFAADTRFHAICSVYNAGDTPLPATLTWRTARSQPMALDSIVLMPHEARLLDIEMLLASARVPSTDHNGILELAYPAGSDRLIAQTVDVDDSKGYRYNITCRMAGELSEVADADYWQLTDTATTLIALGNAAPSADVFTIESFEGGSVTALASVPLEAGDATIIDLRNFVGTSNRSGALRVHSALGARSSFYYEHLVINGSPSRLADAGDQMVDDGGGAGARPFGLSLFSSAPDELPDYAASVNVLVDSNVYYSDGTIYTGRGATQLYTDSARIHVDMYGTTANIDLPDENGPEWDGSVFGVFDDPCEFGFSFTASITFKITLSAYVSLGKDQYDRCLWRPTCNGTCPGAIDHYTNPNQYGTCFTEGRVFKQCWDFWISGDCASPRILCLGRTAPGVCT